MSDYIKNMMLGKKKTKESFEEGIRELLLTNIVSDEGQVRKEFDEEEIEGLAQSIKENGLINPITVYEYEGDSFKLICGERRFRAYQFLNKSTIKAIVVPKPDKKSLRALQLIENMQRKNLSPFEQADGTAELKKTIKKNQDLANVLGISPAFASQLVFISKATPEQREDYKDLGVRRIYQAMKDEEKEEEEEPEKEEPEITEEKVEKALLAITKRAYKDTTFLMQFIDKKKLRKYILENEI